MSHAGRRHRDGFIAVGVLAALVVAGCSSSSSSARRPVAVPPTTVPPSTVPSPTSSTDAAGTVWLCRPGEADDPCTVPYSATSIAADGSRAPQVSTEPKPGVDCFYVYPTVSNEAGVNADLRIQREETAAAFGQASPFSQVCRVWAPMYRQITTTALIKAVTTDRPALDIAYRSLLSAWQDYLANYNDGRPIVFIGHSQGSAMLIRLLKSQVDTSPKLRARTVMAILAGGNVAVPKGKQVGATFQHLPLCSASARTHCVIAYSTFPRQPPRFSLFGRPGSGVSLLSGERAGAGLQVACVNPAAISGGAAELNPEFPTAEGAIPGKPVSTTWVTFPNLYRAQCQTGGGASWLQVTAHDRGGRPVVKESLGPTWGFHRDDVNLALGDLVHDVSVAEANR